MKIPNSIRITHKKRYEVVWIDSFSDPKIVGETRFNPPQIVIKKDHGDEFMTFVHELLHAISNEYDLNLTENQVMGMELAIKRIAKLNKLKLESGKFPL